jgi:hypothetical protein
MKLGRTQHNPELFKYGFLILLSSIIIPPLLLATQIEFLIDGFMRLVKEYPILHLFFWGISSIIMVLIFHQFMKDNPVLASFNKTSADAISVFMGLTASAFSYLFFIIFIGSTSAALAALLFSILVVFIVIGAALKD